MSELVTAIPTGLTAFSATNMDDIIILTLFFSQVNAAFRNRHIVLGQYFGFTTLVLASLPGFFGSLIVPEAWIGMLGIVPIAIGISRLFDRDSEEEEAEAEIEKSPNSFLSGVLSPQTYGVAAVTIANGSDNIGIYVPLFASSTLENLLAILVIFFVMVGVWCFAAYQLTRLPAIAQTLTRYGNNFVPFILIGLGVMILVKSHTLESSTLTLLSLVASCFFVVTMVRNNLRLSEQVDKN